jgi:hypothetical protein
MSSFYGTAKGAGNGKLIFFIHLLHAMVAVVSSLSRSRFSFWRLFVMVFLAWFFFIRTVIQYIDVIWVSPRDIFV